MRAALSVYAPDTPAEDASSVMLRCVTIAWLRAQDYTRALSDKVAESGLEGATVGKAYGEGGPTGEFVRGLAKLEQEWVRDAARFSAAAVQAGLAERTVRLAERQAQVIETVVLAALRAHGLDPDERLVQATVIRELEAAQR